MTRPTNRRAGTTLGSAARSSPESTSRSAAERTPESTPRSAGILPAKTPTSGGTTSRSAGILPANTPPRVTQQPKGWHSRGYLPHMDSPGLLQAITFRLVDSLPKDVLARLAEDAEHRRNPAGKAEHQRAAVDTALDAGHGECLLRTSEAAEIVENALLHFDGQRYRLIAWCVMPNHVHALIETVEKHSLPEVLHSWKSFSGTAINRHLGRSGEVWQRDYFDRYIRDDTHLQASIEYIENNPVTAGLALSADGWRFSSAAEKQGIAGRMPAPPVGSTAAPGSAPGSAGILPATSRRTVTSQATDPADKMQALREKHHD